MREQQQFLSFFLSGMFERFVASAAVIVLMVERNNGVHIAMYDWFNLYHYSAIFLGI